MLTFLIVAGSVWLLAASVFVLALAGSARARTSVSARITDPSQAAEPAVVKAPDDRVMDANRRRKPGFWRRTIPV